MRQKELKKQILRLLRGNARMPLQEIADRLAISPAEVEVAMAEMEDDGTILGYHVLINDEKLDGNGVSAIIEVGIQPERDGGFDNVAQTLCKFPEVKNALLVSGHYDVLLEVSGETLQQIAGFVASKLAPIEGVKSTVTHFLLKKYKEAGFICHEDETYERLKVVP